MQPPAILLTARHIATMTAGAAPYGLLDNGVIAVSHGAITFVGQKSDIPSSWADVPLNDFGDRLMMPALIDCHTHLVHGGNRAGEFESRLNGASYEEIARAGGGILSTVTATRAASLEELVKSALPRLDGLMAEGVTTIEIKSGYGLDRETELNMLRAARQLATLRNIQIRTSFLGAHAIPPEFIGRSDAYIDDICIPTLHAAQAEGLVDAVDGFCEGIAFSRAQIARIFTVAKSLRLPIKLHAEQLSNLGGAQLAAQFGALSADHLEYIDDDGVAVMAKAGTVAVLLPGAFYTLREKQAPPIDKFRKAGVPMAVASDMNPGSSPMGSLLLAMNMASTLFRLTPEESLAGATRHAARALGLSDRGMIAPGLRADLAIWDVSLPAELPYRIGVNSLHMHFFGGKPCYP